MRTLINKFIEIKYFRILVKFHKIDHKNVCESWPRGNSNKEFANEAQNEENPICK